MNIDMGIDGRAAGPSMALTGHTDGVSQVSFSPDGRLLALTTHHGPNDPAAVLVWDLRARKWRRFDCPSKIAQQNVAFWNAAFSPDGRYLAGGPTHPQVAVCIWDLEAESDTDKPSRSRY